MSRPKQRINYKKMQNEKEVLGKLDVLGPWVYKVNTTDKAVMYIRTTKGIADYVGTKYGKHLK